MFERHPNRTLSLYNVCRSVRYPKGHDKIDWRQYAPGLKLWPCVTLQEGFKNVDRKYVLQDACTGTQGYLLGKLDSGVIDFEILRRWLGYCKRHHTECTQTYNSSIPGLKVIDCATGKAIHAPEDTAFHYVALSYVWGGTRSSGKDKDEFPATIHDAITVTVQLGYKYLWVDQYCINQLAGGHKQAQIQLMGRIYSEAELVIIAAAGDSSDYGLPGVGVRAREAQRRTRLDNDVEFIEMNKPDNELRSSLLSTHTEYGAPETHGTESDTESEYERDNERDDEPVVAFQATDGDSGEIEIVFNLLLDIKLTGSDLKNDIKAVLILGSTKGYRTIEEYENGGDPVFMILQAVGDHYKRIGITDYKNICWILEKKTGKMRTNDFTIKLSYDACRGSEQFIYIE
ncbi:unnamed protein product [Alternaria alternata]